MSDLDHSPDSTKFQAQMPAGAKEAGPLLPCSFILEVDQEGMETGNQMGAQKWGNGSPLLQNRGHTRRLRNNE